tara:strand:+ start:3890 stop:4162 length:273 start_codon:yes stop_codon:yes gene_type:complete
VPVLHDGATFEEFAEYVLERREAVPLTELEELYERHLRLKSVTVSTGQGYQSILPPDEQGLTKREREAKVFAEATATGRNIDKLPGKVEF